VEELPAVASPLDAALGLTLEAAADGVARLRLEPGPEAVVDDPAPYLHGGALATCVDTAAWYAAASAAPGEWLVSSLALDALRLARPEPHAVVARCRRAGRTLAVVDVEIAPVSEPGRLVAVGRATLVRARAE
jgi:uncharacterized protein (TIGR00369 family)